MTERARKLPLMPPRLLSRLLSRELAAEYCGVSEPTFTETIGKSVPPIVLKSRKVWDRKAIDAYLDLLSGLTEATDTTPFAVAFNRLKNRRERSRGG